MKKKLVIVLVAIVVISALLPCVMYLCRGDKTPNTNSQTVEKVITDHIAIEISNVREKEHGSFVADVEIAMPDILAIYKHLQSKDKTDGMTLSDICAAISEYAKDTNYITHHTVSAPVHKEGENWVLTSTDCVDEIISETSNKLLAQVVNALGTLDIGEEDEFVWEEKQ